MPTLFGRLAPLLALILILIPACGRKTTLVIFSAPENRALEPLLRDFQSTANVLIDIRTMGSLDIARSLEAGKATEADAVWPASRIWIDQGDRDHVVKNAASIMRSPIVLALSRPMADSLGWSARTDISLRDILQSIAAGKFRFAAASATQSNAGTLFYLAALTAFGARRGDTLKDSDLEKPTTRASVAQLLRGANRSSGSSAWLTTLYLDHTADLDGMINDEASVVEANQALRAAGKPTLCPIYPTDAVAIADHPLGYVDKADPAKAAAFQALTTYLLTAATQKRIQALGRRSGVIGTPADPDVLTAADCFDTSSAITPIVLPPAALVRKALNLYQTTLRKPSATAYVLDFSASMAGEQEANLKAAMRMILDQDAAARVLLQTSRDDVHIVIPFDGNIRSVWRAQGNDVLMLSGLMGRIEAERPDGGTDIYSPVALALRQLGSLANVRDYSPAVILLTASKSTAGTGLTAVAVEQHHLAQLGLSIPIFALAFGDADTSQLDALTGTAGGRLFDARKNLSQAFRDAKGYN